MIRLGPEMCLNDHENSRLQGKFSRFIYNFSLCLLVSFEKWRREDRRKRTRFEILFYFVFDSRQFFTYFNPNRKANRL